MKSKVLKILDFHFIILGQKLATTFSYIMLSFHSFQQIITEAEYVNIFKKRPPSPPPTRRNPKRARTAQTNDQPTKIMNDDNLPKTLSINGSSTSSIPSLQHFSTLSTHELQGAMCNCCILCIAPDCERCHVCRNREQDVNIGFCLRKVRACDHDEIIADYFLLTNLDAFFLNKPFC